MFVILIEYNLSDINCIESRVIDSFVKTNIGLVVYLKWNLYSEWNNRMFIICVYR